MLATRCKPQWPGAVATVCSPFRARARCLGTTTASAEEGGRDGDEKEGQDGSPRVLLPSKSGRFAYIPRPYEPEPLSYLDLIRRTTSHLRWRTGRAISASRQQLLGPGERSHADGASVRPAEPPSSLEHILGRTVRNLNWVCEQMKPILSAVSEDVSNHLVPEGYTHDPATMRTHHLGRWYADRMWLQYESRQITPYLRHVAATTRRARTYIASIRINTAKEALRVQKDSERHAIEECQREFETVAYTMVRELKVARLAGQWQRVWTLERRLASTAFMFLPSQPLASVCYTLRNSDDRRITEISMSRMAEWDDSYKSFYAEDVQIRNDMHLVMRYRAIFKDGVYNRPWKGESPIYAVKSSISDGKEFIVLRLDQSSTPSPLWPHGWRPKVRTETRAGSDAGEVHIR